MTRRPDANVGKSLTVHAKTPEEEEKIRAFKELHSRNPDLTIHDTIMECVRQFLAKHNYPPGNSQTVLTAFVGQPVEKCFRCGNTFHALIKVQFISGLRAGLCRKCFEAEKAKGPYCTIKKVLGGYIKITKVSEVDVKKPERVKWQRATQKFLSALTELEESMGSVPKEKLFSVLGPKVEGVETEKVMESLLREGAIYMPREGFLRKT